MTTNDELLISRAVERATMVLKDQATPGRVAEYYDPEGNYVGASFTQLQPNEPDSFSPADLHCVSLMSVTVDARSTRRLLDPSRTGPVQELLGSLAPDLTLANASDPQLEVMGELHTAIKIILAPPGKEASSSKWVTAAKLCARKRPGLFPVRDSVICGLLELGDRRQILYEAFRFMLKDKELSTLLNELPREIVKINADCVLEDQYPLRLLDSALWMYGRDRVAP